MDIQSLLCNTQQPINSAGDQAKTPSLHTAQIHQRESSWSSAYSSSQPDSPISSSSTSSSLFYSIPSSPDIDATLPSSASTTNTRILNTTRSSNQAQTRTPWSAEEDQLLQEGYSQGLSWAMIATVYLPHRSRGCCWGRFKTLQAKSLEQREWTESEDRLLLLAIKKNSKLFKQVWKSVAQEMGNRNWKECESRSLKTNVSTITTSNTIKKKQH